MPPSPIRNVRFKIDSYYDFETDSNKNKEHQIDYLVSTTIKETKQHLLMKKDDLIKANKGISILSILGAVTFLYLVTNEYINSEYDKTKSVIVILLLVFSCFQIVGGIMTYRNEVLGFRILIGCYVLQICAFSVGVFSYLISTGPVLFIKYDSSVSKLTADVGLFQIAYHLDLSGEYNFFSVNIIAATIILILVKESKRIRKTERR